MSTHHKCDRCGFNAPMRDLKTVAEVAVGAWQGDGTIAVRREPITVTVGFYSRTINGDGLKPDLCDQCRLEIIAMALARLVGAPVLGQDGRPAEQSMRAIGARHAQLMMVACAGNKTAACEVLGISYHTLNAYLRYQPEAAAGQS